MAIDWGTVELEAAGSRGSSVSSWSHDEVSTKWVVGVAEGSFELEFDSTFSNSGWRVGFDQRGAVAVRAWCLPEFVGRLW